MGHPLTRQQQRIRIRRQYRSAHRFHLIKGLSEAISIYIIREFPARVEIPMIEAVSDDVVALYNTANKTLRIRFAHKKRKEDLSVSGFRFLSHATPRKRYRILPEYLSAKAAVPFFCPLFFFQQ